MLFKLYWTLKGVSRSRKTHLNIVSGLDLNLALHECTGEYITFEVNSRNIFNQIDKNNNHNANVNFYDSVWGFEIY
jgi:hypothetical protein